MSDVAACAVENVGCNNLKQCDGERRVAVGEQNLPQAASVNVSCPEVCAFTHILVWDMN